MKKRLEDLCKKRNTNFSRLEKELGFANGSLKKADEKIQSRRLKALADYFHVSMEYLLTGVQENKNYVVSDFEYKIIVGFREADTSSRDSVIKLLDLQNEVAKEKDGVSAS